MREIWERLLVGLEQIGRYAPAALSAIAIVLLGYVVARFLQRSVDDTLKRIDFNRMAAAGGLDEAVGRTGSHLDPVRAIAKLIFWLAMLLVILLASAALGLESINQMFGQMLGFMPTLIASIVLLILGMIVGEFVRGLILASAGTVAGVPTVAKIAKGIVIGIALFMALEQIGVAADIVTAAFTIVLSAVALGVGLAFGLGNRELAGEITRRWYEEGQRRNRRHGDAHGVADRRADAAGQNTPPSGEPPMLD